MANVLEQILPSRLCGSTWDAVFPVENFARVPFDAVLGDRLADHQRALGHQDIELKVPWKVVAEPVESGVPKLPVPKTLATSPIWSICQYGPANLDHFGGLITQFRKFHDDFPGKNWLRPILGLRTDRSLGRARLPSSKLWSRKSWAWTRWCKMVISPCMKFLHFLTLWIVLLWKLWQIEAGIV